MTKQEPKKGSLDYLMKSAFERGAWVGTVDPDACDAYYEDWREELLP